MLEASWLLKELQKYQVSFFSGVPDSLLKNFCLHLSENIPAQRHIIGANEGSAIALATGHHLATGEVGLVYLQNSGIGNAINPLISLADTTVYGIPMLLMIGWRGEPGDNDEPQHIKQGAITIELLDTLKIPYRVLPKEKKEAELAIKDIMATVHEESQPCALVVQKGSFEQQKRENQPLSSQNELLSREHAVIEIGSSLRPFDIVVSTTGMISRELFEFRAKSDQLELGQDFYTVGSMGHSSQIALGIAVQKPGRIVYCIDGDGAFLMHMGSVAIIGSQPVENYKHIVLNNGAHDSVGGQPTAAFSIDIPGIARSCGYKDAQRVTTPLELPEALKWLQNTIGPALLEVHVKKGARPDLGRPTIIPRQNKLNFMRHIFK